MSELEETGFQEITAEDQAIIDEEVARAIDPIRDEDPETAELMEMFLQDHKESTFLFLKWVNQKFTPNRVLYPAAGFDRLPKTVFGEDKVTHTSLEGYSGDVEYFGELGKGRKVTANNESLPFADGSFDAITIFGIPKEVPSQFSEFARVLKSGGIVTLARQTHEMVADAEAQWDQENLDKFESSNLQKVEVPDSLQMQGDSQTEFFIFKKL